MRAIAAIVTIVLETVACAACLAQAPPPRLPPLAFARQQGWKVLGKGRQGRTIEFAQFGLAADKRRVLVIGPLAGNEPAAMGLIDKLAERCRAADDLAGLSITIVRDPNPDGRARFQVANAEGVELDRNFPTADWQREVRDGRPLSGPAAGSEPETQALLRAVDEFRPELIVLLRSSGRPAVASLGHAPQLAQLAQQFAAATSLEPAEPSATAGSLATCAAERGIPTLIVDVPEASAGALWQRFGPALFSGLGDAPQPADTPPATANPAPRDVADTHPPREPLRAQPVANPARLPAEVPDPEPIEPPLVMLDLPFGGSPAESTPPSSGASRSPGSILWPATRIERAPPEGY